MKTEYAMIKELIIENESMDEQITEMTELLQSQDKTIKDMIEESVHFPKVVSDCDWILDDEEYNTYRCTCGGIFQCETETPKNNWMVYCPYCGKKINHNY